MLGARINYDGPAADGLGGGLAAAGEMHLHGIRADDSAAAYDRMAGRRLGAAVIALADTQRLRDWHDWRDIRVGMTVVIVGLVMILVTTLRRLEHLCWTALQGTSLLWARAWLAWYLMLPQALLAALARQRRHSRHEATPVSQLPMAARTTPAPWRPR